MHIPKKYLHDKLVLLLVSINIFLALLCVLVVLLLGGIGQGVNSYIVEYRANLGINPYKAGSLYPLLMFGAFSIVTLVLNIILSIQAYHLRRTLSIIVLSLGALVLLFAVIISYALLRLY